MTTIAILDDGICSSSFHFEGQIDSSIAVTETGSISIVSEPNKMTHGTLCAAIVHSYAPDAKLISIRVLDPVTRRGSIKQIRHALEWCAAHNVSVINLSVGSVSFKDWTYIQPAIANLARNNIPLICACSNNESPSLFTEFSWTISVEREAALFGNQYHFKNGNFLEGDFCASSTHTIITSDDISETFTSQNSHAAPVITAKAYQIIKEHGKLPIENLRRFLGEGPSDNSFHIKPTPDFIDTAIVIGSPLYPQDLLTFSQDVRREAGTPAFFAVFPNASLDTESIKREICGYGNNMLGLLYAGIAPSEVKEMVRQNGCLFWDESEYIKAAAKLPQQSCDAAIVKIVFRGSHVTAARLAQSLQEQLINDGYRCKIFSDWAQAYCLGMVFLTEPIRADSYIYYFMNHYQLDIVLVCSDTIDLEYDMVISCDESLVQLEYDHSHKEYNMTVSTNDQIAGEVLSLLVN